MGIDQTWNEELTVAVYHQRALRDGHRRADGLNPIACNHNGLRRLHLFLDGIKDGYVCNHDQSRRRRRCATAIAAKYRNDGCGRGQQSIHVPVIGHVVYSTTRKYMLNESCAALHPTSPTSRPASGDYCEYDRPTPARPLVGHVATTLPGLHDGAGLPVFAHRD